MCFIPLQMGQKMRLPAFDTDIMDAQGGSTGKYLISQFGMSATDALRTIQSTMWSIVYSPMVEQLVRSWSAWCKTDFELILL